MTGMLSENYASRHDELSPLKKPAGTFRIVSFRDFVNEHALTVNRWEYGCEPDPVGLEVCRGNLRSFAAIAESYGELVLKEIGSAGRLLRP